MYCIQHCFICRPSDLTVSKDAGIEPGLLRLRHWQSEALTTARSHSQKLRSCSAVQGYSAAHQGAAQLIRVQHSPEDAQQAQKGATQFIWVQHCSRGCSVAQQDAPQHGRVQPSYQGAGGSEGCNSAQWGACSVAPEGAAQFRRVQHNSIACSVANKGVAQLTRVQHSSQVCIVVLKYAAQLRRVQHSSGRAAQLSRCTLAQYGSMVQHSSGCRVVQRVHRSTVGFSFAQKNASQLRRVQRSSLGYSLAWKGAKQLMRVQISSVGEVSVVQFF